MTETIKYGLVGKEDIALQATSGDSSFTFTLPDGTSVTLTRLALEHLKAFGPITINGNTIDGFNLATFNSDIATLQTDVQALEDIQASSGVVVHTHQSAGTQGGQLDHGLALTSSSLDDPDHWPGSTKASLPSAGTIGRLRRVTDDVRGLWMDNSFIWFPLGMHIVNMLEHVTGGAGTSGDPWTGWESGISSPTTKRVYAFAAGYWKSTSTITIDQDRVHVLGAGQQTTIIQFEKVGGGIAFDFNKGASMINQCTMRGFAFESTDITNQKIMINCQDIAGFEISHIASSTGNWKGGTSIGIRTNGRQTSWFHNLTIVVDRPIQMSDNPNSTIDVDHFRFSDVELICESATLDAVIEIDTGVNITNLTFDGYQSWVKGLHGLHWIDTTTTASSQIMVLKNVRWEQSTGSSGYGVNIEHNQSLQHLRIENWHSGSGANNRGFKLRNVLWCTLANVLYAGTGVAIDADTSVRPIIFDNVFFQAASTVTLTGLTKIFDSGKSDSTGTIGNFAIYTVPNDVAEYLIRAPVIATGSLPAAAAAQDGQVVIEDAGAGNRNLIIYGGGQRFRIDGGSAV